ncbi:MAG: hypothetical protein M1814_000557 [Vezdaea aestivalis]|nr:MAG: hypothetical protein M1814_000557 [Vezdaea aestivalis]
MATENPSHALNIDPDKPSAGLRPGSGSDDSSSQRLAGTSLPEKVSGSPNNGPATITRPKGSASSRFFRPRTGWRFGVTLYAILIAAVLLLNASFLVFAVRVFGFEDGVGTLKRGSCKDIARLSNWAHLVINALSTTMLAGSNYCMQPYLDFSFQGLALFGWFLPFTPANLLLRYYEVLLVTGYGCFLISIGMQKLCAPTRQEVDRAHSEGKWLDIGVLSLRNLNKISKGRILIWTALALSSIPVHLL